MKIERLYGTVLRRDKILQETVVLFGGWKETAPFEGLKVALRDPRLSGALPVVCNRVVTRVPPGWIRRRSEKVRYCKRMW